MHRFSELLVLCAAVKQGIFDLDAACFWTQEYVTGEDLAGSALPSSVDTTELVSEDSCARPESGLSGEMVFQLAQYSSDCKLTPAFGTFLGEQLRELVALVNSPSEVSLLLSARPQHPPLELESSLQWELRDGAVSLSGSRSGWVRAFGRLLRVTMGNAVS